MRPRRVVVAAATAVVVTAPLVVAAVVGSPNAVQDLLLSGGGAWLASPSRGYVTLVDGPSEQIAATVVAPSSGEFAVTQAGSSALVADGGAVSRVDGATFEVSQPVAFGQDGSDLSVLTGGDAVYVVDATQRLATVARADTLAVTRQVALAAQPGAGQTLVDADGRLWVVDGDGGGLRWFAADGAEGRAPADGQSRLVGVRGRAAEVDLGTSGGSIAWLGDDGRTQTWSCTLDTRDGDDVAVLGSGTSDQVYAAVSQTGTLLVAGTDENDCGTVVPVSGPDADFGQLAQLDHFVFVPDRTTGTTTVVDTTTARVVAQIPLTDSGNDLQLLSHDGIVFYNDLDSDKAGVLRLGQDGLWEAGDALSKYDPDTGEATEVVTPDQGPTTAPQEPVDPPTDPPDGTTPPVTGPTTPPTSAPTAGPTTSLRTPTDPRNPPADPPADDPVPVITAITASGPVTAGGTTTFQATVTNPAGAWSWAASEGGGAVLRTSTSEGDFTVDIPSGTAVGSTVNVQLSVGTSTPFVQGFTVGQAAPVATTTTVVVTENPLWSDEEPSIAVTVTGGSVTPEGSVRLELREVSIPGPNVHVGTQPLVGGSTTFTSFAIERNSDATFIATYTPSGAVHTGSTGQTTVVVEYAPELIEYACVNDNGVPRFRVTVAPANGDELIVTVATGSDTVQQSASGRMTYTGPGGGSGESVYEWTLDDPTLINSIDYTTYTFTSAATGNERGSNPQDYENDCLL